MSKHETVKSKPLLSGEQRNLVVSVIFSTTLLAIMGVASITPAFPVIRDRFHLTYRQVALLITFFTLPGVFLTPLYGILIDRYSRKYILVGVLTFYGIFGCVSATAAQYNIMLIFRFLQGMGNAPLTTLSLTLISDRYQGKARSAMMGYNAGVLGIGTAIFPVIGGLLAAVAWYAPFLLSVLALITAAAAWVFLEEQKVIPLSSVKNYFSQAFSEIRKPQFIGLYTCALIAFMILYGSFLAYFSFFLSDRFNLASGAIGAMISLMSISTACTAAMLGRLLRSVSRCKLLVAGFILYGLSLLGIPLSANLWVLLIPLLLFGTAQGLSIPVIQLILSENAPPQQRAVLMSFFSVVMNGGASIGPVISGIAFALGGYVAAFAIGSAFAVLAVAVAMLSLKSA